MDSETGTCIVIQYVSWQICWMKMAIVQPLNYSKTKCHSFLRRFHYTNLNQNVTRHSLPYMVTKNAWTTRINLVISIIIPQ